MISGKIHPSNVYSVKSFNSIALYVIYNIKKMLVLRTLVNYEQMRAYPDL